MTCDVAQSACAGCSGGHTRCVCHPPRRRGVLLINLGTPDSTEVADVRRYLREFLSDRFVIKLPRGWGWTTSALAALIAHFRAPKSAEAYRSIWTDAGSPLKVITQQQRDKLAQQLGGGWRVYYAMRYAQPSLRSVVTAMIADGVADVVVVPMYPHWSGPSTGTALDGLYEQLQRQGLRLGITVRSEWYDDRAYIDAQAKLIGRFIAHKGLSHREAFLLFSTHSMPQSYIDNGDPYEGQVRRSMELVRRRLGWPEDRMALSFQSKLGPVPWLMPSTPDMLTDLAQKGEKDVVVCPISFTADCLETLEEIGVRYASDFAAQSQGGRLHLVPSLNDDDEFISALASLVRKGPKPMGLDEPVMPLRATTIQEPIGDLTARLIMVGVSTPGKITDTHAAAFVDEPTLRSLQRERDDLLDVVRRCANHSHVDGCFVLNTCQRYEVYALADHGGDIAQALAGVQASFVVGDNLDVKPTVLVGRDAYRRLLSTAAGLNSMLPGDADVIEQLRTARRMAEHAGTLTPRLARVLHEVDRVTGAVREETAWGGFMHDFAAAAMATLDLRFDPVASDGLIIGGSATSRQLLKMMTEGRVGGDRLTFVYRGVGRKDLVKFVRRVAPHARRLRVERYNDPQVLAAIADADAIFLGIDARETVLRHEHLESLRDYRARPLTVVDFNSFGTTDGLAGLDGVRLITANQLTDAARRFGEGLRARPGFDDALSEARRYIEAATCVKAWDAGTHDCEHGPCHSCSNAAQGVVIPHGAAVEEPAHQEDPACQLCP